MSINKVEYNGVGGTQTLIDLTADTVTPQSLLSGATAHDRSGSAITGAVDLSTKADLADLAPEFSSSTSYTEGQYVTYNGDIYRFTANHSAGAWSGNDATAVTIGAELQNKVNVEQGKQLSTEDYTTAEKTKLSGIATGATANTVIDTTCTLTVAGWTGASAPYTQTVNVANILSTDKAWCDLSVSSTVATGLDEIDDWALVSKIESGAGTLTFKCYEEKPTTELNVNVKVVR